MDWRAPIALGRRLEVRLRGHRRAAQHGIAKRRRRRGAVCEDGVRRQGGHDAEIERAGLDLDAAVRKDVSGCIIAGVWLRRRSSA